MRKHKRQPPCPRRPQGRIAKQKWMMAVYDLRSKVVEKLGNQSGLRNRDREIAAVETLQGRRAQYMLGRFHGSVKLGRHDSHIVPTTAELFLIGVDRPRHAPH